MSKLCKKNKSKKKAPKTQTKQTNQVKTIVFCHIGFVVLGEVSLMCVCFVFLSLGMQKFCVRCIF